MRPSLLALAVFALVPAAGNPAALAQEAPSAPTQKIAGRFDPPAAGKGQIIFFRIGRHSDDPWSTCTVREGETGKAPILSPLGQNRYFVVQADPGIHHYLTKTEATDRLTLEIEAGETYFVQCTMGSGVLVGHPDLKPANEADFLALAKKLKPVSAAR
jgi:hypothetical protein